MIDRAPAAIAAAAAAAIVAVVTAAAAVAAVAATSVFAAASPDPASGAVAAGALFSPQQVERGESAYGAWCEACHGKRLSGGEHAPPLNGDIFEAGQLQQPGALLVHIVPLLDTRDDYIVD